MIDNVIELGKDIVLLEKQISKSSNNQIFKHFLNLSLLQILAFLEVGSHTV